MVVTVIYFDRFSGDQGVVENSPTEEEEAFAFADTHNRGRKDEGALAFRVLKNGKVVRDEWDCRAIR